MMIIRALRADNARGRDVVRMIIRAMIERDVARMELLLRLENRKKQKAIPKSNFITTPAATLRLVRGRKNIFSLPLFLWKPGSGTF